MLPIPRILTGLASIALLGSGGCVLHRTRDLATPVEYAVAETFEPAPQFRYEAAGPVWIGPVQKSLRYHDVVPLSFQSGGDNGHPNQRVSGLYLRSRSAGAKKLVIVLPIWGSSEYPPRHIAHGYADRSQGDAQVLWLSGDTPLFPWTELSTTRNELEFTAAAAASAERYRAAVIDIRRLVDWAETRPEIDSTRIALIGFSMSALVAATTLGNDPRISAAVLMMGGAQFADIFATCSKRVSDVRKHAMDAYGWSNARFRDFFAGLFAPADPIHFAGHYDPSRIFMIDASFDDCMPRSSREALWNVTGRPERMTLPYSHRVAFYSITPVGLNFGRRKIYRFLDRVL